MSNKKCLENLAKRLEVKDIALHDALRGKIKAIERTNAGKGMLKSGRTIKEVMHECETILNQKTDFIAKEVGNLPFKPSKDLFEQIVSTAKTIFPEDLGEMQGELKQVVQLATGSERALEAALTGVEKARKKSVADMETRIQQHVISIDIKNGFSNLDKLAIGLEAVSMVIIVFLAGKWSVDPQGNYEPYIVILGVLTPIIEIARRVYNRFTTQLTVELNRYAVASKI